MNISKTGKKTKIQKRTDTKKDREGTQITKKQDTRQTPVYFTLKI